MNWKTARLAVENFIYRVNCSYVSLKYVILAQTKIKNPISGRMLYSTSSILK